MNDENFEDDWFQKVRHRFEEAYDASDLGGPYRDEQFIKDAIMVFCIETMQLSKHDTTQQKAAASIASRLMGLPDLEKEWRVSFPYVFLDKEKALTPAEIKRRSIAFQVRTHVRNGIKVTHAIAQVAALRHFSSEKIRKDYYDWLPEIERHEAMAKRSKNGE